MQKKLIFILVELAFLAAALFIESPFEFLNSTVNRIVTLFIMLLTVTFFIILYRQIQKIDKKNYKIATQITLGILAIPYLYVGILTAILLTSDNYPMWRDISVYTNAKNQKVISQWIELSGSLHDFRDRKIIAELGQVRISFNCEKENLKGVWTEYNIEKDSTRLVDFDKGTK